jgi:outer membrane protein assembly factor BamB
LTASVRQLVAVLGVTLALAPGLGGGEEVVNFRNGGTGAYPDADPPLEWSVTKNVRWRWDAPLLGPAISSPILVGDRVITLARPMAIVCLDKDTGRELWRRERYVVGSLAASE